MLGPCQPGEEERGFQIPFEELEKKKKILQLFKRDWRKKGAGFETKKVSKFNKSIIISFSFSISFGFGSIDEAIINKWSQI